MRSVTSLDHMFEDVELLIFDHVMERKFLTFEKTNLPHAKRERLVNMQEQCSYITMDAWICTSALRR